MKVSSRSCYAIMALVDLALESRPNGVPINELAEKYDISYSTMEIVFSKLRRIGIVRGRRGRDGGYVLAREPKDILIGEVVAAVEDLLERHYWHPSLPEPDLNPCMWLWKSLSRKVCSYLQTITLEQLLAELDLTDEPSE